MIVNEKIRRANITKQRARRGCSSRRAYTLSPSFPPEFEGTAGFLTDGNHGQLRTSLKKLKEEFLRSRRVRR